MTLPTRSDAAMMTAWLREAADELDKAHGILDSYDVPRKSPDGTSYTLAARIVRIFQDHE